MYYIYCCLQEIVIRCNYSTLVFCEWKLNCLYLTDFSLTENYSDKCYLVKQTCILGLSFCILQHLGQLTCLHIQCDRSSSCNISCQSIVLWSRWDFWSHCLPQIAVANCKQWYIIFCILPIFLINLNLKLELDGSCYFFVWFYSKHLSNSYWTGNSFRWKTFLIWIIWQRTSFLSQIYLSTFLSELIRKLDRKLL